MKTKHKHWAVLTASTLGLTGLAAAANLGGEKYTYDASGNILEKSIDGQVTRMSYNASNKVTFIASGDKGSEQISYDAAGRPVSYTDASGQPTRQFTYGYADKVLKVHSAGNEADFFYNAEGLLVGKAVAGETTSYAWDGNVLAAQGAETFANEEHITGGVPAMAGDQAVVVSDYLGNTLSQGNSQIASSAYGEGLEEGRFTGKPFVKELDAFVFQHRLYSAVAGSWNTFDPQGFPDGLNNSIYVNNCPLESLDPLGLAACSAHKYIEWEYPEVTAKGGNYTIKLKVTVYSSFGAQPFPNNVQPSGSAGSGITIQSPTASVKTDYSPSTQSDCSGHTNYENRQWTGGVIMGQCDFFEAATSTYTPGMGDVAHVSELTHHEK